ncbi:hypothetical protein [Mycolicibacterium sphagni]|uniref:Uncharacterized protein n=1 Tax=Mycolicibacterium sphagni TaxID=1786 RepID=A0A255DBT0_9MYCO|nr:hypothetical protein [Mycolicibacterium sphagni]OYN76836.1 hypothetical protein CG716_20190 [Mycolicibacterium sphagni]
MGEPIRTGQLLELLKRHYIKPGVPLPGGIFLPEVGWNGGNTAAGGCDAIYVGFTSTSGRILVGHELKVSRADWLNELNKPGKADGWADECHEWWLVVSDPAFVHDGELPAGWGLMSPGTSKTRMTVHQKPDRKPTIEHQPSWKAVRSIMARQDTLRAAAISAAKDDAHRAATAEVEDRVQQRIKSELGRAENDGLILSTTRQRLQALEKALGHNINWDEARVGWLNHATLAEIAQIREALEMGLGVKAAARRLAGAQNSHRMDGLNRLERAVTEMRAALAQLESLDV